MPTASYPSSHLLTYFGRLLGLGEDLVDLLILLDGAHQGGAHGLDHVVDLRLGVGHFLFLDIYIFPSLKVEWSG